MNSAEETTSAPVKSKKEHICLPLSVLKRLIKSGIISEEIGDKLFVRKNSFTSRYGETEMISIQPDWNKETAAPAV